MWVLECSGDALKGKKLWMRPGRRLVFGRTKSDDTGEPVVLSHKTISRKHLTVKVSQPKTENYHDPCIRSTISVRDFDTKIGTLLNDVQIRGRTLELQEAHNSILLGRYEQSFHLNWIPVVLTFSLTSMEYKTNTLAKLCKSLGPHDIKILVDYESNHTTHVATKKRNTAKSLHALIDGKYIVHSDTFIDALVVATCSKDGNLAPLEADFDRNFPNPMKHLPPKGDEPTQRDEIAYAPDLSRKNIFCGYTFVFYEERQYDNLLPPLAAGRGKTALQIVKPYQDTAEKFVIFVQGLAGKKTEEKYPVECESKGVVVVRFNPSKGPESDWYAEFGRNVALHLNQRLIEQNEFLDAILASDASTLRSPLQVESAEPTNSPDLKTSNTRSYGISSTQETQPLNRVRRTTRPKFTGFDDDFSGPIEEPTSHSIESSTLSDNPIVKMEVNQSQGLFVSQDVNHINEEPEIQALDLAGQKRKVTTLLEQNEIEEQVAGSTLTSLRLKRRRLDNHLELGKNEDTLTEPIQNPLSKDAPVLAQQRRFRRKINQDIDAEVEEILAQKRERDKAAEAAKKAKSERESLYEELDSLETAEIRKKIQIGEAKVKEPNRIERIRRLEDSARWSDHWNGRKNFKKFRLKGVSIRASEKVIVQLKEANKNKSELFDHHFDKFSSSKLSTRLREGQTSQETIKGKQQLSSIPSRIYPNEPKTSKILAAQVVAHENISASIRSRNRSDVPDMNIASPTKTLTSQDRHTSRTHSDSLRNATREDRSPSSHNSSKRAFHALNDNRSTNYTSNSKLISSKRGREESDEDESEDELKFRFKSAKR